MDGSINIAEGGRIVKGGGRREEGTGRLKELGKRPTSLAGVQQEHSRRRRRGRQEGERQEPAGGGKEEGRGVREKEAPLRTECRYEENRRG